MPRPQRFLWAFDIHSGKEQAVVRGKRVVRPTDNPAAMRAFLRFAEDFEPDIFGFGGDQLNCGPVSHWHRGKPRLVEGFRMKDELDTFGEKILERVERLMRGKGKRRIWLNGNHEAWIDQFVDEYPQLEGMIEVAQYLDLDNRDWEIYSTGEMATIGKSYWTHGDIFRSGFNPAQKAVNHYRRNLRFGHFHTYMVYPLHDPLDITDNHTAISVPCLAIRGMTYGKGAANNCLNGFIYGYVDDTGDFCDYVVVMHDNKFTVDGKSYNGNKL
jgi:hypothetical protein